jgi:ureidoacrylate peracid hydrolase
MQNGFVHPEGSVARLGTRLPDMDAVIDETEALLASARAADIPVVYTRHLHRSDYIDGGKLLSPQLKAMGALVEGTWDGQVIDRLAPRAGDVVVDKRRYDAFLYTDMEVMLRALGVDSVLITGVATHACVESTARAADMRDYRVAVASDCTTSSVGMHEPALRAMAALGMTVAPWREGLATLVGSATVAA